MFRASRGEKEKRKEMERDSYSSSDESGPEDTGHVTIIIIVVVFVVHVVLVFLILFFRIFLIFKEHILMTKV